MSNTKQGRFSSTIKWAAGLIIAVWLILTVNAFQYFHESGVRGIWLSARHAIHVLSIPDDNEIDNIPDSFHPLTRAELVQMTIGKTWTVRLRARPDAVASYHFVGANVYELQSNLGVGLSQYAGIYIIDGNRICHLTGEAISNQCYRLYMDREGRVFRPIPRQDSKAADWQSISKK